MSLLRCVGVLCLAAAWTSASGAQAGGARCDHVLRIQTLPVLANATFAVDGRQFRTRPDGTATLAFGACPGLDRRIVAGELAIDSRTRARFARWYGGLERPTPARPWTATYDVYRRLSVRFVDLAGHELDPRSIEAASLRSSHGQRIQLRPGEDVWLHVSRVVPLSGGLREKEIYYTVERVVVRGAEVVNRGQQRLYPLRKDSASILLLFYPARFAARDALFGSPRGERLRLTFPDGSEETYPLDAGGSVTVPSLPRGEYRARVEGGGISLERPVSLSRRQDVELEVISVLDLAAVGGAGLLLVGGLLLLGRPQLVRSRPTGLLPRTRWGRFGAIAAILAVAVCVNAPLAPGSVDRPRDPVPVLAYYYIWFNASSWNRAKVDYPVLGRYSSDERTVMRRHIRWAKAAGIDGFLVSWKSTPTLDRRLDRLVEVARSERFKLAIIYQGLDFSREPLPVDKVSADLERFAQDRALDEVFRIMDRPLVVWSGTWRFSVADVARVAARVGDGVLLLGTERDVAGVQRLGGLVDGNAYYWSSVNPDTFPDYPGKLRALGAAVHERGGVWIAPAAPGFDARLVGGTTVVERRDGATLRRELDAAFASAPDLVGLISWNEFSENTHLEPSERYGDTYLGAVADVLGATYRLGGELDSSAGRAESTGVRYALPLLVVAGVLVVGLGIVARRRSAAPLER